MKLSITDKFLWRIYDCAEKAGDVAVFAFQTYPKLIDSLTRVPNPIFEMYRHEKGRRKFSNLIYYLKINGYIKIKSLESKQAIILTKEGISKALKASFTLDKIKKRKDGKWIMLIFDIPQKQKGARALLRSILRNLNYKLFQQSVWVSPYDVSAKTEKLLQLHSLDKYVKIFLIEEM